MSQGSVPRLLPWVVIFRVNFWSFDWNSYSRTFFWWPSPWSAARCSWVLSVRIVPGGSRSVTPAQATMLINRENAQLLDIREAEVSTSPGTRQIRATFLSDRSMSASTNWGSSRTRR
jgi:hypothetical protein